MTTIQNFQKYFGVKHSWQQYSYKIKFHQVLFNKIRLYINYGMDINIIFQIFGYDDERKWFRFFHKSIKRIIVSRVVTFIESKQAQDDGVIN